jgi:hypothetical protein
MALNRTVCMTSGDIRLLTQRKITAMLATIPIAGVIPMHLPLHFSVATHESKMAELAGCDTQRDGASGMPVNVNTAAVVHVHRGADDDDWDYENESAPEPDFNGGGAPLEQRPRCPGDGGGVTESEAQVPEFDGGGGAH